MKRSMRCFMEALMKILIDTHIFLWLLYDPGKIKQRYIDILGNCDNQIYISSLSIAEIMIKKSVNKLDVEFDLDYSLEKFDAKILDFDARSALLLESLPFHHRDPFDRMIISQAITGKLTIFSVDRKFQLYACRLL